MHVYVAKLLLNYWTDFNDFCVYFWAFENGLDSQFSRKKTLNIYLCSYNLRQFLRVKLYRV